jgi:hypothetical protein
VLRFLTMNLKTNPFISWAYPYLFVLIFVLRFFTYYNPAANPELSRLIDANLSYKSATYACSGCYGIIRDKHG